jgi:outer membrane protein OmpA-like peptidoglycan-associated protein
MTRVLISILTVGLLACGGSAPRAATPRAATTRAETSGAATSAAATPGAETTGAATTGAATAGVAADDRERAPADSGAASPGEPGPAPRDTGAFAINQADKSSRPQQAKLAATDTEAAVRFFVIDKDKGPIKGIVISLTSPTGQKFYTEETDAEGFAEVLVPIATTYDLVYLSLGRRSVAAQVTVANQPRLNLKLTMRYRREELPPPIAVSEPAPSEPAPSAPPPPPPPQRFVLQGVQFDTGKATLTASSHARLDTIVEYMTHKKSAQIEISGHTDNVGNKKDNKKLSQQRADAVRDYLVSKGIDAGRIRTVGYGDERPIASNDTPEGRQQNRRIEAAESL